jgi:predicted permease
MNGIFPDLGYAARTLRRTPAFTTVAIITLALGIGANTAIFTFIDALFFEPLPVAQADRLVEVHQTLASREGAFELSYTDYVHYRDNTRAFTGLAAHYPTAPIQLTSLGDERQSGALFGAVVTWNYFPLLGISPAAGRFFVPEEDRVRGRDAVAVISHELWQLRFAGSAQALGARITLNGLVFTVVGVAPARFHGVTRGVPNTDVWIPSAMFGVGYRGCDAFDRSCRVVHLLGRLEDSHTIADAQAEMDVLARQLATAYPDLNKDRGVRVSAARGIRQQERAEYAPTATLLAATVGLVLLTACANLAGLLLARGVKRRREIAIRLALGAGRSRLIKQLLTESLLLALLGGVGGLVVAGWTCDVLSAFYGTSYVGGRLNLALELDAPLLAITLLLSLVTALMVGVIPAWQASRPAILPTLKSESMPGGAAGSRLREALIVFQVALAVVLGVGAALLMRSVRELYRGPGFDLDHVAHVRLRPSMVGYDAARARAFQDEVVRRLEALPGVASASPALYPPLPGWGGAVPLWLPGQQPATADAALQSNFNRVGFGYFKTLGVRLIEGREFDERDQQNTPRTIIVSDVLAKRLWSDARNSLGRSIIVDGEPHLVVGVAKDVQYHSSAEPAPPFFYLSYKQQDPEDVRAFDTRMLVNVTGDPRALLPLIRRTIQSVDANVPLSEEQSLAERVSFTFRAVRGASTFLLWLSALALLLSTMGLYAVLAFTVSQRTRELAIRVALGATQSAVASLVLRHAAILAGLGSVLGLVGALAAAQTLRSLLYGVQPYDSLTLLFVPAFLIVVALAASYLPARRASRVDPLAALRFD